MSEYSPNPSPNIEMAPAVAVGGLLTVTQLSAFYKPLLAGPSQSTLPIKERFVPIPGRGLGTVEECYGHLEPKILQAQERLQERIVLIGHSLGGLIATMAGLEHPDKIAGVVCLAGAQQGIKNETFSSLALRTALRNPPGGEDLRHDSDFMTEHRGRIATSWSSETSLHLVSPTYDDILLLPQGLGLELPEGQQADKRYMNLPVPGTLFMLRRIPGMPKDIKLLPTAIPAGHVDIAVSPKAIAYTRHIRRRAAMNLEHTAISGDFKEIAMPKAA